MGVLTSEVGYTPAMPRREDHEVHKRTCGGTGPKKKLQTKHIMYALQVRTVFFTKLMSVFLSDLIEFHG